jgi:GNAT superfamily N-acetyltransferase
MSLKRKQIELDITLCSQVGRGRIAHPVEPEDFVLTVESEILGTPDPTAELPEIAQHDVLLGKLIIHVIQAGRALQQNQGIYFPFDAHEATSEAGFAIFDMAKEEFHPLVEEMFPDACPTGDILLLHRLTIHPLARGKRLGLAVLHRIIEDWSKGCSLVVMKPFPLQFEAEPDKKANWTDLKLETFSPSESVAFGRLRNYYQHLGFKRIGQTKYFALSPDNVRPSAGKLRISNSISVPLANLDSFPSARG